RALKGRSRRGRGKGTHYLGRRIALLYPVDKGLEVIALLWPRSISESISDTAAMSHARRTEQAIECLDCREVGRVPGSLVTPGHSSVVVDHPAREDQLVVAPDDGDHFPAALHKAVEWAERVGYVGDVVGAVLRHLRIRQRDSRQRNAGAPLC